MKLLEILVMNPNRRYDAIKNYNKRFLMFFISLAFLIIPIPLGIIYLFGLPATITPLLQVSLMLPLLGWRLLYLKLDR